jgi:uncharacterized protein YndB with AHSA1/START domain
MTETTGFTITRTFAAPPEAVFDAWVTPSSLATWWGGNQVEVPLNSVALDARPGGSWKATLIVGPDMPEFHWYGEYIEVDRPNKLVMTMSDKPGDDYELFTLTFTAVDGGTEMVFTQSGGNLTPEEYAGTSIGWQVALDALEAFLAAT